MDDEQRIQVRVRVFEDRGNHVPLPEKPVAEARGCVVLQPDSTGNALMKLAVDNPRIWDLDTPNLYVAQCSIYRDGECLDEDQVLCGIRTLSVDGVHGLRLNGKSVKIKGGCMHHDNGILGAASFYDSEYRRLKLHKENGFNGIRSAHNPMSKDMLEACDRLGLLMYAEAFDVWRMGKNINDYHLFFEEWWQRDMESFIKRDRNHPCIFAWSIGNEVTERNGLFGGDEISGKLSAFVRSLDTTRSVSAAVPTLFNGMDDKDTMTQLKAMMAQGGPGQNLSTDFSDSIWADRTEGFCAPLDIVGYNYLAHR